MEKNNIDGLTYWADIELVQPEPVVPDAVDLSDAEARVRADGVGWLVDQGVDPAWLDFVVSADYEPSSDFDEDFGKTVLPPKKKTTDDYFRDCLSLIDRRGLRYEYEERAAILEYDGGMSRKDADRAAAVEILNRK